MYFRIPEIRNFLKYKITFRVLLHTSYREVSFFSNLRFREYQYRGIFDTQIPNMEIIFLIGLGENCT